VKRLGKTIFAILLLLLLYNLFVFLDFGNGTIDYLRGKAARAGAAVMHQLGSWSDSLESTLSARADKCLSDDSTDSIAPQATAKYTSPASRATATPTARATSAPTGSQSSVTPSFKKTMDDYEKFFDDYIAFMKKYNSNTSDLTIISSYTKWLTDYARVMNELKSIDENSLTAADQAYYIEVMSRINYKLAQAAY